MEQNINISTLYATSGGSMKAYFSPTVVVGAHLLVVTRM